jgi:hypothetical protein
MAPHPAQAYAGFSTPLVQKGSSPMRSFATGRLAATSHVVAVSAACSPSSAVVPGFGGGTLPSAPPRTHARSVRA